MNHSNYWFLAIFLIISTTLSAQKTAVYTDSNKDYMHALGLYNNRDFAASKQLFSDLKDQYEKGSEKRADCAYYEAFSAIQLGDPDGEEKMRDFVDRYPTSTKHNIAFLEVGDYYFKNASYPYALKWYNKVETRNLSIGAEEDYNFKYGYSLFAVRSFSRAKEYFQKLLNSYQYGAQAKYYYGFIAYQDDDFENADRYLNEVADNKELGDDVPYYMANIKFKMGNFQEAIDVATSYLPKADRNEHSELSKIIGESYFNLEKYKEAIPHLLNYKGRQRRWNNTDYYLLGYAYYKQKDYENAIANFNKIIGGDDSVAQNAYYHLAECYLNTDLKTEALNAFRNASQMDYDNDIKRDAWLNYAKLSYEIGNPYKSVPDVLKEYMELYPKSEHLDEMNKLLISAYVTSKDYEGALKELKDKKDPENRALYQKVALYRGIQLFNENELESAIEKFNEAIEEARDNSITARSVFWKAESAYLLTNFDDALKGFQRYKSMQKSDTLAENKTVDYNIGYAYFKLKDYNKAGDKFQEYLNTRPDDEERINDSYLRLGDAYFVSSNYRNALNAYEKVIKNGTIDTDYATFQRAMSLGFLGKNDQKIVEFQKFLSEYASSNLRDDVYYELGNTYVSEQMNDDAIEAYDNLIKYHKKSSYVSKALLKQGLVYYNTERDNQALDKYRRVVKEFPNTDEAKQAVSNARQVYVDLGRVDEYAEWVKDIDFVEVTDADLDKDMYESAEKQYLQNDRKKAITAFEKYIARFPNGVHKLQANFYLAESLYAENQKTKSEKYYTFIIDQERNEFTEQGLSRLSQVYLDAGNWKRAIPVLERLEEEADFPQNITYAQSNLMKGHYELENYTDAVAYAEKVLQRPKLEDRIRSDAKIIIARSAFKTGDEYKAQEAYEEVQKIATGELKAEAIYYDAYFKNKEGNYKVSNTVVQKLVSDYAAYKYYGAKGLIIMAKNFYELDDAFQATYILESVIKNFADYEDVVSEAKAELQRIKTEEAKTNESVNPNQN